MSPALNAHMETFRAAHPDDVEEQREEKARFIRAHGIALATLEDVADHIEYIAKVGGWDHVGIGTDWEGTGGHHPRHLEDVSKIPLLTAELLRRGHGEPEIRQVLGENMLRVLGEAQEVEI